MKFQYYNSNVKNPVPIGFISLPKFLETIKNPKPETAGIFEAIKEAEEVGDMKLKAELKMKLYYFTPSVIVKERRQYKNILSFTGLLVLDFDHLEPDYAKEFKEYLFNQYSFIIAAWLSPSKHGLKCLVNIPVCSNIDEYKSYFLAIEQTLGAYHGFDSTPKNCVLPLFLSYDSELLQRDNATQWNKKYFPPEPIKIKSYIINEKSSSIEKILLNNINKVSNAGHPIVRATAYALGGYIAAGYIDEQEAFDIICRMIDSHAYLSQKSSVYKQTAKDMIKTGKEKPLYLK
jgi:hypothetical protein